MWALIRILKAIYTVFLALGSLVGGTCGGYIVNVGGIAWVHWVNVILAAITFVLCLVFQAETLYDRPITNGHVPNSPNKSEAETKEAVVVADSGVSAASYPQYSYMRTLKLITYRPGLVHNFVAPYKTLRLPGVWLVSLWYAGLVGLIVTVSTIGTQLVAVPPYLWGKNVGLINVGGLIGAALGCVRIPVSSPNHYMLTVASSSIHTCRPIGQPSASQRKTAMVTLSPSHVSSLHFRRSRLPQLVHLSLALLQTTPRPRVGLVYKLALQWWHLD